MLSDFSFFTVPECSDPLCLSKNSLYWGVCKSVSAVAITPCFGFPALPIAGGMAVVVTSHMGVTRVLGVECSSLPIAPTSHTRG